MIAGFFGDPRAGKTLSMVAEVQENLYRESWRRVYSNIHLNFSYTPLTLKMVLDASENTYQFADDCIVLVDEIYVFLGLDSRSSSTNVSKAVSWFLMQTGKMGRSGGEGMLLYFTSQYPSLIDVRLWQVASVLLFCDRITFEGHKFIKQKVFFRRMMGLESWERVIPAEPYYALYDTRERVTGQKKEDKGGKA